MFRQRDQILSLTTRDDGAVFVEFRGPWTVQCQATGADVFGGHLPLDPAARERMTAAGWQEPGPSATWRFYTARVDVAEPGEVQRLTAMTMTALRDCFGLDVRDLLVEDTLA